MQTTLEKYIEDRMFSLKLFIKNRIKLLTRADSNIAEIAMEISQAQAQYNEILAVKKHYQRKEGT